MPLDPAYAERFQELYGERFKGISSSLINLFLLVAEQEGITISELKDLSKLGRATLTNMLRLLGPSYLVAIDSKRTVKMGYGLINLRISLENRREREVVLSIRGRQIFKELRSIVESSA